MFQSYDLQKGNLFSSLSKIEIIYFIFTLYLFAYSIMIFVLFGKYNKIKKKIKKQVNSTGCNDNFNKKSLKNIIDDYFDCIKREMNLIDSSISNKFIPKKDIFYSFNNNYDKYKKARNSFMHPALIVFLVLNIIINIYFYLNLKKNDNRKFIGILNFVNVIFLYILVIYIIFAATVSQQYKEVKRIYDLLNNGYLDPNNKEYNDISKIIEIYNDLEDSNVNVTRVEKDMYKKLIDENEKIIKDIDNYRKLRRKYDKL